MEIQTALTQEEYEADILRRFQENSENRDRALARCLWHLERLTMIAGALEGALPQISALAENPLFKRLMPNGNGR